jgi:eukaryotic-like serine/threonine-protein kinase
VDPLDWERISEMFAQARLLAGESRIAFLKEHCGQDQELFKQVLSLLEVADRPGPLDSTGTVSMLSVPEVVAGRFRIIRYIAEGGMGTVFEAEDLTLNDLVALKTIRPEIVSNPKAVERFKREILLGKKITHPNICRIYDIGVDRSPTGQEFLFLTMQYLNGETLASRIKRGPLPEAEALPLVEDMADALSAAHQADVIHRDFKSGNVMLVSGANRTCAVVTDFGLARGIHDDSSQTQTGMVGTVEYMAPEQIRGKELTPAADVYALGVVMYEMVTGHRPFTAESKVTVAMKHLHDEPQPPRVLAPHLGPSWDQTILRCLKKKPGERFQTAAEVKAALVQGGTRTPSWLGRGFANQGMSARTKMLAAGAVIAAMIFVSLLLVPAIGERLRGVLFSSSEKHIAVLPLEVVGGNLETQALGDGLMDSLAGRLSNLDVGNKTLWVVPASEVRSRKVTDPSAARREFGATIVVKGSFERDNSAARLKLTLIDPKNMRAIGFVEAESQTGDLAALQDEAVTRLGRLINISVREPAVRGSATPATHAAYENYLTAVGYMQRYDRLGNLDLAIAALHKSLAADDRFALGYAKLGEAYRLKYELDHDQQWVKKALDYCEKAIELDAHLSTASVTLAKIHELSGQHELAVQEFRKALDNDPRDAAALNGLAYAYEHAGHVAEAEQSLQRAAALRPDVWDGYNELGNFYDRQGKFAQSIDQYKKALRLTPDNATVYANLGATYMDTGDPALFADAASALTRSLELNSNNYYVYANLGFLYGFQHRFLEAAAVTEKALKINEHDWRVWTHLIVLYDRLKEQEKLEDARKKTLDLVEQAVQLEPQDAEAQSTLAMLYARGNLRNEALVRIRTSLALAPDNPQVLSNVAEAYDLLNERRVAKVYVQKSLQKGQNRLAIAEDPRLQNLVLDSDAHLSPN